MRVLALVVLLLAGCGAHAPRQVVQIPTTPEALSCKRECMGLKEACEGNVRYVTLNGQLVPVRPKDCAQKYADCFETCPGACIVSGKGRTAPPCGSKVAKAPTH